MKVQLYDSPVAKITYDENGVFICTLKKTKVPYDKKETKDQFDFFIKHSKGSAYKVILDTAESYNFPTDGSFDYFFKNNKSSNKIAIVTHTLSMRLLLEQTYRINEVTNALFFKTVEEAYNWIIKE